MPSDDTPFLRHLRQCNTAVVPGNRFAFSLGGQPAGWIDPAIADRLEQEGLGSRTEGFALADPADLETLGEKLAHEGFYRSHHELFDVRLDVGQPAIARIDRGALPLFGLVAIGVHMNGLVRKQNGLYLWTGRRARNKRLDPGKLDHLVAGGVPADHSPAEALLKEAAEEASIAPEIAAQAQEVSRIVYALNRPEGLRRDILYCYDLFLPEDFTPEAADGEVESFSLIKLEEAFELVRETDEFKFNVNLVLIDLFLRNGLINPTSPEGQALQRGLASGLSPASPGKALSPEPV
ncbi:NUDIX hydrolase [Acetobacter indonesiensis]|uniref:Thiamine pyrophosphokinase n=1 Tax=Acetobacter indonesiensis TaxID=104101 RepID=A0A252AW16_9PROT|nr:NUDIX domain-containing protein [Acetobacter indonesiensis]OUI94585.1 thiamine pyrophosphokinase [Acetobacter indonesiensis]